VLQLHVPLHFLWQLFSWQLFFSLHEMLYRGLLNAHMMIGAGFWLPQVMLQLYSVLQLLFEAPDLWLQCLLK
jgi:hypothetical protein